MCVWVLIVSVCLIVALRGRFAASPFWTVGACFLGVAVNGFYLGTSWSSPEMMFWPNIVYLAILVGIQFGFIWMFFRSLTDISNTRAKLRQVNSDLLSEVTDLKRERPRYNLSD